MRTRLAALLHVLAAAVLAASVLAVPAPNVEDLLPYTWSLRRIISTIEGPSESGDNIIYKYELLPNLPTKAPVGTAADANLLPQAEQCDRCAPGTTPQPADAGRVNSLMRYNEGRGTRAPPGQFPWHVGLLLRDTTQMHCSGSLLSSEWVLTAANCVYKFPYVRVQLGSNRPGAEHERFRQVLNCTHFVWHPGYTKDGAPQNDIAVIKLPQPVKLNSFVMAVRLPGNNHFLTTYAGRPALLSSWGAGFPVKPGEFGTKTSLGCLAETILPNERCAEAFGRLATSSLLCTTTTHFTGGSLGDSGAPLVVEAAGTFIQVGVLAFASTQGFAGGHPAGFTRVTSYMRWIQNATGILPGPDVVV